MELVEEAARGRRVPWAEFCQRTLINRSPSPSRRFRTLVAARFERRFNWSLGDTNYTFDVFPGRCEITAGTPGLMMPPGDLLRNNFMPGRVSLPSLSSRDYEELIPGWRRAVLHFADRGVRRYFNVIRTIKGQVRWIGEVVSISAAASEILKCASTVEWSE